MPMAYTNRTFYLAADEAGWVGERGEEAEKDKREKG